MVDPIPPAVKEVWERWNIRGTILFSLSLQTFLVLVAPYRKSTRSRLLMMLIWSAYLLADATANFTVGLISKSQGNGSNSGSSSSKGPKENEDLLAFWAPFLLLHLGGPDTITAFALEDNELWLRHLLGLVFQAIAALYVFAQSISNRLWILVTLVFIAGTIKYVERTRALYLASLDRFRDSMLKEADAGLYAKLMEEYAFRTENKLPTQIIVIPELDKEAEATGFPAKEGNLNDLEVLHYAYKYFLIFKGLVVDLIFSFRERNESREFFQKRTAVDALRVIEVELNFIYEVLFTKVQVVHSIWGYIFRGIAFGSILAALGLFHFRTKKDKFNQFDVGVTYTLLLGAVALDLISLLMLFFSDWTFATIKDPDANPEFFAKIFSNFLWWRRPWWQRYKCETEPFEIDHHVLATPIIFRRWSGSLSSYNLISYCLRRHTSKIHKFRRWRYVIVCSVVSLIKTAMRAVTEVIRYLVDRLQLQLLHHIIKKTSEFFSYILMKMKAMWPKGILDEIIYVSREPFTKELWEFIFQELKTKAYHADDPEVAKIIASARGEWILIDTDTEVNLRSLMQYVTDVQYDESLLLWHIATDLCYHTAGEKEVDKQSFDYREFSKILSDYVLYLLIMQPTMMSAVADIGKLRFRDTCVEAKTFFREWNLYSRPKNREKNGQTVEVKACEAILSVNKHVEPMTVKGHKSKSVLFEASMLAQELNRLEKEGLEKWKLVSRVWVELISYAASQSKGYVHAQQVSRGGELITFIWLLMVHFGLGKRFQVRNAARTALIV